MCRGSWKIKTAEKWRPRGESRHRGGWTYSSSLPFLLFSIVGRIHQKSGEKESFCQRGGTLEVQIPGLRSCMGTGKPQNPLVFLILADMAGIAITVVLLSVA